MNPPAEPALPPHPYLYLSAPAPLSVFSFPHLGHAAQRLPQCPPPVPPPRCPQLLLAPSPAPRFPSSPRSGHALKHLPQWCPMPFTRSFSPPPQTPTPPWSCPSAPAPAAASGPGTTSGSHAGLSGTPCTGKGAVQHTVCDRPAHGQYSAHNHASCNTKHLYTGQLAALVSLLPPLPLPLNQPSKQTIQAPKHTCTACCPCGSSVPPQGQTQSCQRSRSTPSSSQTLSLRTSKSARAGPGNAPAPPRLQTRHAAPRAAAPRRSPPGFTQAWSGVRESPCGVGELQGAALLQLPTVPCIFPWRPAPSFLAFASLPTYRS